MSQKNSTALAVGAAIGGAAVAAFLNMGTAHAVVGPDADGYSDLFGASGTPGILFGQTATDTALDSELFSQSPGNAAAFDTAVDLFQSTGTDHGVTQLINALDPSAFISNPNSVRRVFRGLMATVDGRATKIHLNTL